MDVDDEIRRAQQERLSLKNQPKLSTKTISYDDDIYGGGGGRVSKKEYNVELDDDDSSTAPSVPGKPSRYSTESRDIVRKALNSYTAPKELLESRPKADSKEDVDNPFEEFKRKTVAEREDEYRARWRKRKLSPPRVMAFGNGKKSAPAQEEGARSYREIMMEQQLEKEKKEVLRKIQKKKEEEEENRKRELKDRNHGTLWDVKEEGTERSANVRSDNNNTNTNNTNNNNNTSGSGSGSGNWVINVIKSGQRIGAPIVLDPQATPTFTIGRERTSSLPIDHPSCSKQHATITFRNNVPQVTDLGSTNGTKINDTQIQSHKLIQIKAGDTIIFGASTREYTLFQQ